MRSNANRLVVIIAVLAGGCQEPTTIIGSACEDGTCLQPDEEPSQGGACLFTETGAWIDVAESGPTDMCLPNALALGTGQDRSCDVRVMLPAAMLAMSCIEAGLLPPRSAAEGACLLQELGSSEREQSGARGWYWDPNATECGAAGSIHVTEGAVPDGLGEWAVYLDCGDTFYGEGRSSADGDVCRPPSPSSETEDLGKSCTPIVPEGGFDDRAAYVMTGASECATGACVVYKLRGDPSPDCTPRPPVAETGDPGLRCVSGDEVDQRVYCSCRCAGPEGDPGELCDCPDMFSCVQLMTNAPPGVRGGYCVRNAPFFTE